MLVRINEAHKFLRGLSDDALRHEAEVAPLAQPELVTKLKKTDKPVRFCDIHPERWKGQGKRKKVMK